MNYAFKVMGIFGLIFWTALSLHAAATLSIGHVPGSSGSSIDVPVQYKADPKRKASTVQFDLILPSGVSSTSVAAGPAAQAAQKNATSAVLKDRVRVIVFGVNQNILSDGHVATITLKIDKSAKGKNLPLALSNTAVADAKGVTVPSVSESGTLSIQKP